MPDRPLRPCKGAGCGELGRWPGGRCDRCAGLRAEVAPPDERDGQGYGRAWRRLRLRYVDMLVGLGILPVCGAVLPGGPDGQSWSLCRQAGVLNGQDLALDHEPPLTPAEREQARRGDRRAVDDVRRLQFLCRNCHNRKTKQQNR